jgi:hypothetical protein
VRRFVAPAVIAAMLSVLSPAAGAQAAVLCDISGSLVTASGVGVPGVGLWFHNGSGSVNKPTSADGGFAFAAACGQSTLQISWRTTPAAGLPTIAMLRGTVEVTDGGSYALRLPPAVKASVTVVDGDHADAPVAGALVYQTNESNEYTTDKAAVLAGSPAFDVWTEVPSPLSDSAGKATLVTFPDHDMTMSVRPPSGSKLLESSFVLNAGTNVSKKVVLSETPPDKVALTGVVRDSAGRGVPGLLVALPGTPDPYISTDATGAFKVWGAPGATTLGGWTDGAYPQEQLTPDVPFDFSFSVPLTLTATSGPVEITLPPVAHVRINLTDHEGHTAWAALEPPPLSLFPSEPAVLVPGTAPARLWVDQQSELAYDGVISFNFFPTTSVKGLKLRWDNADGDTQYLALPTLDLRTDRVIDVQLPPPPVKHVVSGTITDADGRPVTGLQLSSDTDQATVDSRGRFSLPVIAGHDSISVNRDAYYDGWARSDSLPDYFWLQVPLDVAGPMTVALKLPRAHRVAVTAVDPVGHEPVKGAWIGAPDGDDWVPVRGLTVSGASGPAYGSEIPSTRATDAAGKTALTTFTVAAADLEMRGRYAGVDLISKVVDLEVTGDKTLELVLGTSASPRTYRRPGDVSGVTAAPAVVSTSVTRTVTTAASAPGATSALTAAAGTMSATVRWAAPRRTGGTKIRGYRVIASPGGKSVRVGASARAATLAGLPRGTKYSFIVRAVNAIGPARGASAKLDIAAPKTVLIAPTSQLVLGSTTKAAWKGTDDASGVASYDVRIRSARIDEPFGRYTRLLSATRVTSKGLSLNRGHTYCVSARARDRVGRVGAWSPARCVSRPLDDAALKASPGWDRAADSTFYAGTVSRTTTKGAALRVADVRARTLWIVATTCPTCGTVTVRHAGVVVARLDLRSATTRHQVRLRIEEDAVRSGTVSVTASDPRGAVHIDALAAQRAA